MFLSNGTSLSGVNLLSSVALVGNLSSEVTGRLIDENSDFTNVIYIGLPAIFFWVCGVGFVSYHTDEDGYVTGARKIESKFLRFRWFSTLLTYAIEGTVIAACAFGPATTKGLKIGATLNKIMSGFLFNGGDWFSAFPAVIAIQTLMIIFMVIPMVLYKTLPRNIYDKFADVYVRGRFGFFISFIQDCFMFYLVIPFFVVLFVLAPCTWYLDEGPATALDGQSECMSPRHRTYVVLGATVAAISFVVGILAGTVPVLVERNTDIALNGRFTSIHFAMKAALALTWVLFHQRHEFVHLVVVLVLQIGLLALNLSLRPCLVERINFHRSASYCFCIGVSFVLLLSAAMNEPKSALPVNSGVLGLLVTLLMLLIKYYVLPCGKLFPAIPFRDGKYEGGLVLGLSLPQGHGVIHWDDEGRVFGGSFLFGLFHGYGVTTQAKLFFQGMHSFGRREGFGVTNMMDADDQEFFEGSWLKGVHHGSGMKRFRDGNTYDGTFDKGLEHGNGVWSFETATGRHTVKGTFEHGIFTSVKLTPEERLGYEGDMRYGVPHGLGRMVVNEDEFEGEWRAGRMHGNGTVRVAAGAYEGIFSEGNFCEEGTWKDAHETYTGKWLNNLKHGAGVQELAMGTYDGQFVKGERHGYGTFTYSDGTVYQGTWQANNYHGAGTLRTADGAEYEGFWLNGKRHGKRGAVTYENGEKYVGGWQNDMYHGEGVLAIPHFGEYSGMFDCGRRHGAGRVSLIDGSQYIGDWADDDAAGQGNFVFTSRKAVLMLQVFQDDPTSLQVHGPKLYMDFGGVYDGNFERGTMNGHGTVNCGDGTSYTGEWIDGLPHGSGTLSKLNGGLYVGELECGLFEGQGRMTYSDGRVYHGGWRANKRHGLGSITAPNGEIVFDGDWINDVPSDPTAALTRMTHEDDDIPEVDIEDFMRTIMPAAMSPVEVLSHQIRRRIELDETWARIAVCIWIEEELMSRRIVKGIVAGPERFHRRAIELAELAALKQDVSLHLVHILNQWKYEFSLQHGRDPKKSDILKDPWISNIYRIYMDIAKDSTKS